MRINCYQDGRLVIIHDTHDTLAPSEILRRYRLGPAWTVAIHPDNHPEDATIIQRGRE